MTDTTPDYWMLVPVLLAGVLVIDIAATWARRRWQREQRRREMVEAIRMRETLQDW